MVMVELEYALPLCDHSIRASQFFDSDWVKCECGIFYNKSTLNNYRDALRDLANADRRASIIENFAGMGCRNSIGGRRRRGWLA